MILTRRRFFFGLLAAPAIVKFASLMPVKAPPLLIDNEGVMLHWRMLNQAMFPDIYPDEAALKC